MRETWVSRPNGSREFVLEGQTAGQVLNFNSQAPNRAKETCEAETVTRVARPKVTSVRVKEEGTPCKGLDKILIPII